MVAGRSGAPGGPLGGGGVVEGVVGGWVVGGGVGWWGGGGAGPGRQRPRLGWVGG